jgi:hypothetical protein
MSEERVGKVKRNRTNVFDVLDLPTHRKCKEDEEVDDQDGPIHWYIEDFRSRAKYRNDGRSRRR